MSYSLDFTEQFDEHFRLHKKAGNKAIRFNFNLKIELTSKGNKKPDSILRYQMKIYFPNQVYC